MTDVPAGPLYTKNHEWVVVEAAVATVGITDHAQSELGDITFVELPEKDMKVRAGDETANIESVKAAVPVYAPVSGQVVEVNAELEDAPESVNRQPYEGWLFRIKLSDPAELDQLMSAAAYEEFLKTEAEVE